MERVTMDAGYQFAMELVEDIRDKRIVKDCLVNHSDKFTSGMEDLHRRRFRAYLSSCGCYLTDLYIREQEVGYSD